MSKKDGISFREGSFNLDNPEGLVLQIVEALFDSHKPMNERLQFLAGFANGVSLVNAALRGGEPVDKVTEFTAEVSTIITSAIMDVITARNKRREKGGEA